MQDIIVRGARTHNLKNITVQLPRHQLVVITGLSGSGKSSLAFDTLYAEGQRRYVESLSAYARQFLSVMEKPDVDQIEGLSPAISIEQKSTSHNPRSTVGTVTEIYDYLRVLFARVGVPHCPTHKTALVAKTVSQMVDYILTLPEDSKILLMAPIVKERKGEHIQLLEQLREQGYVRVKIDGELFELDDPPKLDLRKKHTIEVVVDRLKIRPDIGPRLTDSLETTLRLSDGLAKVDLLSDTGTVLKTELFSSKFSCIECGYALSELEPRLFSFNNPVGACSTCDGLGVQQFIDPEKVVINPALSLSTGAIRAWDRHNIYYYSILKSLAKHYRFDLEMPFKKLSKKVQDILLYGSGDTELTFQYDFRDGTTAKEKHVFEGIVSIMMRRYRETESIHVREELAKYLSEQVCQACQGTRLNVQARHVLIKKYNIADTCHFTIKEAHQFFQQLTLSGARGEIAKKLLKEIVSRLEFLINVGLEYLSLQRSATTLSGGEAQRIRLASQIGAGLVGVLYVLDEPSIGLHQRDNAKLLKTLFHLRDLGNTVIVVEHDEEAIRHADYVLDIGPGAGVHGGAVVYEGSPVDMLACQSSLTGQYLSGKKSIPIPKKRLPFNTNRVLTLKGASGNNLKNITAVFPIGLLTCITGVSGSGKSTLINDTLYPLAARALNGAEQVSPAPYKAIEGLEQLDKVIDIDQSPIGRTPRSNAATYTGLFSDIRDLFAGTQEALSRAYKPGRFSFNVKGGRCEACQGDGLIKVEMHFLPDIYVDCDVCHGKRYNRETLEVLYKGKNIHQVLEMTVEDAMTFFNAIPAIKRKLETLIEVGLGYLKIGQSATTLSGGEAQRIKLAKELARRSTGKTLYILDEPTTGLHFHDIYNLMSIVLRLREQGNTILIIEHNLDVIKMADWVIDLGPEGGGGGGQIIATGTPEAITTISMSHTGQFLKPMLSAQTKKQ
ncbi:MAG: excinuclease subunit [Pseudomonadota bacterium]|jgi:excinuclease ABC subunit A